MAKAEKKTLPYVIMTLGASACRFHYIDLSVGSPGVGVSISQMTSVLSKSLGVSFGVGD